LAAIVFFVVWTSREQGRTLAALEAERGDTTSLRHSDTQKRADTLPTPEPEHNLDRTHAPLLSTLPSHNVGTDAGQTPMSVVTPATASSQQEPSGLITHGMIWALILGGLILTVFLAFIWFQLATLRLRREPQPGSYGNSVAPQHEEIRREERREDARREERREDARREERREDARREETRREERLEEVRRANAERDYEERYRIARGREYRPPLSAPGSRETSTLADQRRSAPVLTPNDAEIMMNAIRTLQDVPEAERARLLEQFFQLSVSGSESES